MKNSEEQKPEAHTLRDGRYQLIGLLGSGGSAIVWRVNDLSLGVERAIKMLHPANGMGHLDKRLHREAQVMARLEHPNVLTVFDTFLEAGRPTIVMELACGSIADWVATNGPIPERTAVGSILGLAQALQLTHNMGVVHRDIKPANLLLDAKGTIKLGDFGIASTSQAPTVLTQTGALLGSYAFMAPEQRTQAAVTGSADQYALAATLVWMMTARPPGDLFVPEHAASVLAALSPALISVIQEATSFSPSDRFPSMAAFGEALSSTLETAPADTANLAGFSLPTTNLAVAHNAPLPGLPFASAASLHTHSKSLSSRPKKFVVLAGILSLGTLLGATWLSVNRDNPIADAQIDPNAGYYQLPECANMPVMTSVSQTPRSLSDSPGATEAVGGTIADLDNDGLMDAVFSHQLGRVLRIYWGSDNTQEIPQTGTTHPTIRSTGSPTVGDLNADGILDIVQLSFESDDIAVSLGREGREFDAPVSISQGGDPTDLALADWDNDGHLDLLLAAGDEIFRLSWRTGLGDGTFGTEHTTPLKMNRIATGPLMGGHAPWVVGSGPDGTVRAYSPFAADGLMPTFQAHPFSRVNGIRVDENQVWIWGTLEKSQRSEVLLYAPKTPGNFESCRFSILSSNRRTVDVADINQDGRIDALELSSCPYCTSSYRFRISQ